MYKAGYSFGTVVTGPENGCTLYKAGYSFGTVVTGLEMAVQSRIVSENGCYITIRIGHIGKR